MEEHDMGEYLHGAYGQIQAAGMKEAAQSRNAIVYVGTAPVHTVAGGAANVNVPILVQNIAEARKYLGYSSEWDKYTLCEAMHHHLETMGVGPLVFINVLSPVTHKAASGGTASLTPVNGRMTIAAAESIILDSVVVKTTATPPVTKVKGTDYAIAYDSAKGVITIVELTSGALGTAALALTYDLIDATAVDEDDVIGAADGDGLNTGLYAVKNVYQETGCIPTYLLCPGFGAVPEVHAAMVAVSAKINGHWDAYLYVDLPILDGETAITLANAHTWRAANGYNRDNETVYFPLVKGTDGKTYHLSVLAMANLQALLINQDDIPYRTPSNTECAVILNLYLGEANASRLYDDEIINEKLNKNGIASAAYVGGRWAIWGAHSADYTQETKDQINVSETSRMMLFYISNDFQHRRQRSVDKPMTANDIRSIIAEEQSRLDALVKIGALTYGKVEANATENAKDDMVDGDYSFVFNVTTTPLAKSMKAIVNWTDEGFTTYYAG
jgi:phage tail sheath protein FI